jgi:hypothetical protein
VNVAPQVELRTLEMGASDLDRYCKGLEKALLKYHAAKMENINQARTRFAQPAMPAPYVSRPGHVTCLQGGSNACNVAVTPTDGKYKQSAQIMLRACSR